MTPNDDTRISRRQATALVAALAATIVTAAATAGGFAHWQSHAQAQPPAAAQLVQAAPTQAAPQWTEESD